MENLVYPAEKCRRIYPSAGQGTDAAAATGASSDQNAIDRLLLAAVGLAAAYVPWQPFSPPMDEAESLCQGTVFAGLVQPYERGQGV